MPSYLSLIKTAIVALKDGSGKASGVSIKRHLGESKLVDELNSVAFKQALAKGVVSNELKKIRNSYKLGTKAVPKKKSVSKPKKAVKAEKIKKATSKKKAAASSKKKAAAAVTVKKVVTDESDPEWRYPPCKVGGNHGMCASCCRAGFTKQGYVDYFNANPRRALPRPPERRSAPPPGMSRKYA